MAERFVQIPKLTSYKGLLSATISDLRCLLPSGSFGAIVARGATCGVLRGSGWLVALSCVGCSFLLLPTNLGRGGLFIRKTLDWGGKGGEGGGNEGVQKMVLARLHIFLCRQ
jgi:hypothetical protein